ncbi:MAG: iron ABC transporter permease [Desulfovibrio sp.]|nr:iron ABC transporter permease [Desulfovibrio sp.]
MSDKRILFLLAAVFLSSMVGSIFLGMSVISPSSLFEAGSPDAEVFWRLRVPRTLAAFLSGAGLAVSGLVFQAMFRNPLATPFTLGVSSGAALGASLYIRLGLAFSLPGIQGSLLLALLGGLLSMLLVYLITRAKGGFSTPVMLLAGVIINFFFSSLVIFIQYWSNARDALQIMRWLMGSLSGLDATRLVDLGIVVCIGSVLVYHMARELDLLTAGEELAASRGVAVRRVKLMVFVLASVMVGAVVSLVGPIGFVGMMVPHICRLWLGAGHHRLVPVSFVLGGCFLALCDLTARTVLAPAEIPTGIITAMIGGPFFLWTLFRSNRDGELL